MQRTLLLSMVSVSIILISQASEEQNTSQTTLNCDQPACLDKRHQQYEELIEESEGNIWYSVHRIPVSLLPLDVLDGIFEIDYTEVNEHLGVKDFKRKRKLKKLDKDYEFEPTEISGLGEIAQWCMTQFFNKHPFPEKENNIVKPIKDNKWTVMRYDKKDFFPEHVDTQYDEGEGNTHFANTILLPPTQFTNFEGGEFDMRFATSQGVDIKKASVRPTEGYWTYIIVRLRLMHQVMPIKSGERISILRRMIITEHGAGSGEEL